MERKKWLNFFLKLLTERVKKNCIFAPAFAQVAELVDASVSKTDEVTLVPVRSRPRVQKRGKLKSFPLFLFLYSQLSDFQYIFINLQKPISLSKIVKTVKPHQINLFNTAFCSCLFSSITPL